MQYTIAAPAAVAITYIIFKYAIFSLNYLLPCPQVSHQISFQDTLNFTGVKVKSSTYLKIIMRERSVIIADILISNDFRRVRWLIW